MGSLFRRGNRLWIKYKDHTGKWVNDPTGLDASEKRRARKLLDMAEARVAAGLDAGVGPLTVAGYAKKWIEQRQLRDISSVANENTRLRLHVLPTVGQTELAELRPKHVRDLVRRLRAATKQEKTKDGKTVTVPALAPRTVRHVYGTLRCMLGDALVDDLVPLNACALRRHDLPPDIDSDPAWREKANFQRHEIVQLISDPRINSAHRVLYALLALAGPRVGGCVVRRWRDVDFMAKPLGKLSLTSKWRADVEAEVPGSKAKIAIYVPIHPTLAKILRDWWLHGWFDFMGRHPTADDLIIPLGPGYRPRKKDGKNRDRGGIRRPSNVWQTLQRDLERIGLRNRRAHDLRVACVSLAREDGARPDILKWITHGPSKRSIIDIYTRLPWETLCAEVSKLKIEVPEAQVIALPKSAISGGRNRDLVQSLVQTRCVRNDTREIRCEHGRLLEARIGLEPMNEGFAGRPCEPGQFQSSGVSSSNPSSSEVSADTSIMVNRGVSDSDCTKCTKLTTAARKALAALEAGNLMAAQDTLKELLDVLGEGGKGQGACENAKRLAQQVRQRKR